MHSNVISRPPTAALNTLHKKCKTSKLNKALLAPLCLLLILCLNVTLAFSTPLIQNPVLTQLSPDQGLSQATINSMIIDHEGFLWLATEGGLNRYDGYNVKQIEGPKGLLTNAPISYLFQDRKHRIWISTYSVGVYSFTPQNGEFRAEFIKYHTNHPEWIQSVRHMIQLESGELLFALSEQIILMDEDGNNARNIFTLNDAQIKADDVIRKILVDGDWLYIALSDGLQVMHLPSGKYKHLPLVDPKVSTLDQRNTKELHQDEHGTLWVGAVSGLYSLSRDVIKAYFKGETDTLTPRVQLKFRNIWKILPGPKGIYLATDEGLYFLRTAEDSLQHLLQIGDSRHQVSDEDIQGLVRDKNDNLWMATGNDGAFYWSPRSLAFNNYYAAKNGPHPLTNDTVYSLLQDKQEALWIGTNNGLNRLDIGSNELRSYLVSDDSKSVASAGSIYQIIASRNAQQLWIVTAEGLQLFDKKKGEVINTLGSSSDTSPLLKGEIYGAALDDEQNIWFMRNDGAYKLDVRTGSVKTLEKLTSQLLLADFHSFLGISEHFPTKMMISMTGGLWLYDLKSAELSPIHQLAPEQLKPFVTPDNMVIDKHNTLWIGYAGAGLFGLDASTFESKYHYHKENQLPSNVIYGLQLDNEGNLWMSSHAGLINLNVDTHEIQQFTIEQGLQSNEFNAAAYTTREDGVLAYGSSKGFTLFDPLSLKQVKKDQLKTVAIAEINLLSSPGKWPLSNLDGQIVELEHDDVGLSINFSSLDFVSQKRQQYQYKLAGEESLSYPPSKNNDVFFAKLNPGNYVFSVKAIGGTPAQNSNPAFVSINVSYPPWQSPTAYFVYAFIVLALALIGIWLRVRRQQKMLAIHQTVKRNEQRLQLALASSGSGVWDWYAQNDELNQPRIYQELGYEKPAKGLTIEEHSALIHPQDKNLYELHWKQFFEQERATLDITYRLKTKEGLWQWHRDLGSAANLDAHARVSRAVGTYTNVTDSRANEQKASLFGEAFKQTRDWVFILDHQRRPLAVNDAFNKAFDLEPSDQSLQQAFLLMITKTSKWAHYDKIMTDLVVGNYWQGEDSIAMPNDTENAILIKINAVADEQVNGTRLAFYVLVMTDISEQKAAQQELSYLANYDSLTQLPNRSLLINRIQHGINYAIRRHSQFAVFFIDLDKFKQVNDSLGHEAGDTLLIEISKRLVDVTRAEDTVARLGGDEFVVLMENVSQQAVISDLADKILHAVDMPILLQDHTLQVSASIGIAVYPQDADSPAELLKRADIAMYHAKNKGDNHFQFFTESMNEKAYQRLTLQNKLREALEHDQFINYYQPIVDSKTQQTCGFELLLRWQSDEGIISPAEFIPLSEELGLIIPMTWRALEKGLAALAIWHKEGSSPYLSVNLSVKHIETKIDIERLRTMLKVHELPVSALRFEITESALIRDQDQSLLSLNALHDAGFHLSLDDFGTGYSSLKYLQQFPLQYIKIDQSFVSDIGNKKSAESIIIATLMMADGLDMECIAEGIETQEQVDFFSLHQCHYLQGYIFSRPAPFDETIPLLSKKW